MCVKVLEPIADEQLVMNGATAVLLQDTLACLACKVSCYTAHSRCSYTVWRLYCFAL